MFITIEDIDQAYRDCKKRKGQSSGCVEYQMDYLHNNYDLWLDLNNRTYKIGKSRCFVVTRPKLREVFCAQFRDRVVHHVLYNKFRDILEAEMSDSAFACRPGKGTDYGIHYIQREIERISEGYSRPAWVMKCDMQAFFMSIDKHGLYLILDDVIRRDYHGEDIEDWLWLWRTVILNRPEMNCEKVGNLKLWDVLPRNKSLFKSDGKGLPIGNLPSQVLANLLLSSFDRWMITRLGERGGYGRYVDDFICISQDKDALLQLAHDARIELARFGITMHPDKFYMQEVKKGVEFVGAVIKQHRLYVTQRSVKHLFEVVEEYNRHSYDNEQFARRMNSLFGHMVHKATYAIRRKAWKSISRYDIICTNMRKFQPRKNKANIGRTQGEQRTKGEKRGRT